MDILHADILKPNNYLIIFRKSSIIISTYMIQQYQPMIPFNAHHHNQPFVYQAPTQVIYVTQKLQHINCIEEPTSAKGGLYLGDIISVMKPQIVKQHQIAAILTCNIECQNLPAYSEHISRKIIPAKDTLDYPINIHFEEAYDYIDKMRKNNKNVLVHCHAGISRSAALVCAYLMRKHSWTFSEAFNHVKGKRPRIKPNQNFIHLLQQFDSTLDKSNKRNAKPAQNGFKSTNFAEYKSVYPTQTFYLGAQKPISAEECQEPKRQLKKCSSAIQNLSRHNNMEVEGNRSRIRMGEKKKKTRIPWYLLEKKEDNNIFHKKLFLFGEEEIKGSGCFF